MANKLYQIVHTDPDGTNQDLLVVAPGHHAAIGMWLLYYHEGDRSEVTWLDFDVPLAGFSPTEREADHALKVFEVRFDLTKPGPVKWHDDVVPVCWLKGV